MIRILTQHVQGNFFHQILEKQGPQKSVLFRQLKTKLYLFINIWGIPQQGIGLLWLRGSRGSLVNQRKKKKKKKKDKLAPRKTRIKKKTEVQVLPHFTFLVNQRKEKDEIQILAQFTFLVNQRKEKDEIQILAHFTFLVTWQQKKKKKDELARKKKGWIGMKMLPKKQNWFENVGMEATRKQTDRDSIIVCGAPRRTAWRAIIVYWAPRPTAWRGNNSFPSGTTLSGGLLRSEQHCVCWRIENWNRLVRRMAFYLQTLGFPAWWSL